MIKPFSAITPDDIQDWKARYGDNLSEVEISNFRFVVKKPSRSVLDLMAQHGKKQDVVAVNKALVSNCVLGGDIDEMENDGGVYATMLEELTKLMEKKKAVVKKL